jgi:uncharacterized protein with FMN-binding domain
MKRAVLAIVSTIAALVMLLSFKTHGLGATAAPPAAVGTAPGTSGASGEPGSGSSGGSGGTPATGRSSPSGTATFTGDAANTRYGPVQVRLTVSGGHVSRVEAVEYPMSSSLDAQINGYAIPTLNAEARAAGSASIDMVSGATYTSQGYIASLQSALDQAGL